MYTCSYVYAGVLIGVYKRYHSMRLVWNWECEVKSMSGVIFEPSATNTGGPARFHVRMLACALAHSILYIVVPVVWGGPRIGFYRYRIWRFSKQSV